MAIKIRQSTFETNSSSVHAIVVDMRNLPAPLDTYMYTDGGEFGWERDVHATIEERLSYIWQAICDNYDESECMGFWTNAIHKWLPRADLEMPRRWNGYIDHGEELVPLLNEMHNDENLLGCFLLGYSSYVETGNNSNGGTAELLEDFDLPQEGGFFVYEKYN